MTEHDLDPIADRLRSERPAPSPAFRGELRRRLSVQTRAAPTSPMRLRLAIAACAASGALLLAIAAIGLAGIGPLAG